MRNTPENTLGIHIDVCPACLVLVPYGLDEAPPDACHGCGVTIIRERCAYGRCTTRFPEHSHYPECGKPAIACSVDRRWGECAEHVGALW
jgi:hypothetical protein